MSLLVIDNFLPDYDSFRGEAIKSSFAGEINPLDGVMYPDISIAIPDGVRSLIIFRLIEIYGEIKAGLMFMRLTTKNTDTAPHQAHHDLIMGEYTCLLYMSEGGGTSILGHIEGEVTEELWARDTNIYDRWVIKEMIPMKHNRLVVFPSGWMHRAEPVGGFGDCAENGRLVLTFFFGVIPIA
jgi:hypothetical protein